MSRVVFQYGYMQVVVDFALQTLKANSPIGSSKDAHPGLYRDSHMVFFNGHVTKDVSGWKPGDEIDISNPAPYARKIETGSGSVSVPVHTYEKSAPVIQAQFPNVKISFVYMPVRFGDMSAFTQFGSKLGAGGHRVSVKEKRDWLVHQPALQIR